MHPLHALLESPLGGEGFSGERVLRSEFCEIEIAAISSGESSRFCYTKGEPGEELLRSVKRFGLLSPIGVVKTGSAWELVYGSKRCEALRRLDFSRAPARVLDGTAEELLDAALEDNLSTRELTGGERARFVRLLIEKWSLKPGEVALRWAARAGLAAQAEHIADLARCAREADLLAALDAGSLDERSACEALALSPPARAELLKLAAAGLKFTRSEFRDVIRMVADLCAVGSLDAQQPFARPLFSEILADTRWDPKKRAENFVEALRNLRYPELSDRRARMDREISRLRGLCGAVIRYDPSFESKKVEVSISAAKPQEMRKAAEKLAKALDAENCRQLFTPLED